ncbi:hypothetical protein CR513_26628, partial [Mucuna pruriens]
MRALYKVIISRESTENNYLHSSRQRNLMFREVGGLLQCFQEQLLDNPSFYHALQLDTEE